MLDIDDFKMINDTQGHAVGDMVLSQTGSILSEVTGDRGIVGRLGGDEFAVFASGFQNSVEMEEFCVSLRENLKKIIFDMEYSVSIGAAKLDGRRISFPDFYYEADRAVYAAKRGGKNRIVFYDQIKENQEPETADPVEPILAQGNEKSMLRQLRTCMEALGSEGIGDALMQTFEALRQYFDADCVVLAYAKEGGIRYVEECHRDTAQMMARLVTEEIESGDAEGVIQEIGQLGDVVIPDIKSLRDYCNLDDSRCFRDHESLVFPIPACTDGRAFYYRNVSFTKPEELEKRLQQALRKKQPVFIFHWRGGGLNRQILSELLALAGTLAQARGKQASCSVNVPQGVIQLQFSDAPEPDITIQQANEGEAAPETQTVSE